MKKAFALILALALMACLLAGCGTTEPEETADTGAGTEAPAETASGADEPEAEINVAYIAKNTVDAFHARLNNAAGEALDKLVEDGTIDSWQLYDGLTDPNTQINLTEDAINNGANFFIVLPAESDGCAPIVSRCAELGFPVILIDSATSNVELATTFVGFDFVKEGEIVAQYVIDNIPEGGKYAHLMGVVGNTAQVERGQGIANVLGAAENWESVGDYPCEWSADKAVQTATDILTKYGEEIKAIVCDNDDMSCAVQAYCNSIGREDVICIGMDGNDSALSMIAAGTLRATVYQGAEETAAAAIALVDDVLAGEEISDRILVDTVLVTAENVADYYG